MHRHIIRIWKKAYIWYCSIYVGEMRPLQNTWQRNKSHVSVAFYHPIELTFIYLFLYTPCLAVGIFKTGFKKVTKKHSRYGRWGREGWWRDRERERHRERGREREKEWITLGRRLRKGKLDRRDDVSFDFWRWASFWRLWMEGCTSWTGISNCIKRKTESSVWIRQRRGLFTWLRCLDFIQ